MTLTTLLWDMDGTLLDSEPVHEQAFYACIESLGLSLDPTIHESLTGASGEKVHQVLQQATGTDISFQAWQQLKFKHYQTLAKDIQPLAGIPALLETLIAHNTPMAVVSNSTRDEVDLNLSVSGLVERFPHTISRDEVNKGKPDPEGYLAAAQLLSAAPEQCIVIEDSVPGAIAGVAAGMTTIYHPELAIHKQYCPEGANLLKEGESLAECLFRYLELS